MLVRAVGHHDAPDPRGSILITFKDAKMMQICLLSRVEMAQQTKYHLVKAVYAFTPICRTWKGPTRTAACHLAMSRTGDLWISDSGSSGSAKVQTHRPLHAHSGGFDAKRGSAMQCACLLCRQHHAHRFDR